MRTPRKVACVEIGGIPISLATNHETFFDLLLKRYEAFLSASPAEFELEFDIVEAGSVSDDGVSVRRKDEEWQIERGDFLARWNPRTRAGCVRQNANAYSLDSVLRILHSLILAERGGFLLHAASAICEGNAYLFSGVSGAGKTTITRLAPHDVTLLTDEISYIRPGGVAYEAFGTPFAGELAKSGEKTKAGIAALFFLEKGPENRVEELAPAEAVRRLMRNILSFAEDRTVVEKLLATACDFVERVPIRRLTFYPDSRVWDEVRRFGRDLLRSGDQGSQFAQFSRDSLMGSDDAKERAPAHA